jgi:hypothetical protein
MKLYKTSEVIKVIASDTGLSVDQPNLQESAEVSWFFVLDEAVKHELLLDLVKAALRDYPNNKELQQYKFLMQSSFYISQMQVKLTLAKRVFIDSRGNWFDVDNIWPDECVKAKNFLREINNPIAQLRNLGDEILVNLSQPFFKLRYPLESLLKQLESELLHIIDILNTLHSICRPQSMGEEKQRSEVYSFLMKELNILEYDLTQVGIEIKSYFSPFELPTEEQNKIVDMNNPQQQEKQAALSIQQRTNVVAHLEEDKFQANMPEKLPRRKLFISYSTMDEVWLERLQTYLKPIERKNEVVRWDATKLRTGDRWEIEIKQALDEAKIAVLLVSADFMASDFIDKNELPPLLEASKKEGLVIMPVIVNPCYFTRDTSLSGFQTANEPEKPLISMTEAEWRKVFQKLCDDIEDKLKATDSE